MDVSVLFQPVDLGPLTLKNRLVHVATIGNYGHDGLVTPQQMAYYARRAQGGIGLIVTEGVSVHETSKPNPAVIRAYVDEAQPGLARLAAGCHAFGVPVLLQLWHVGRQQLWGPTGSPWGVSTLPDALSGVVPHVMTAPEILELQAAFVNGARVAKTLGFDGVELHAAHGYLLTQFLSPWSNLRDDEWGRDYAGRLHFVSTLLRKIREACGPDFVLAIKLSGSEFVPGGLTETDTMNIVQTLTGDHLLDLISVSQGNFSLSLERHVPDMHFAPAPFAHIIGQIRTAAHGVPVVAIGRIGDPEVASRLVTDGTADLIGMSRAVLSDPDLPRKWQGVDPRPVRRCIACNVCWGTIHQGKAMVCIHNPELGSESRAPAPAIATRSRCIHVIGGGPAGMEVAWVAQSRGYQVTLWEQSPTLGGQIRTLASMPGLGAYGGITQYQEIEMNRHGVEVVVGHRVTAEELAQWSDAWVIFATGSVPQRVPFHPRDLDVRYPHDPTWIEGLTLDHGTRAWVVDEDGGYYAYGPAEHLMRSGFRVTLVTSRTDVGANLDYLSRIGLQRRLREQGVTVFTGMRVLEVWPDTLWLEDVYTQGRLPMERPSVLIWAGPRQAHDELWRSARTQARVLSPIGDAYAPRAILAAIHEGHRLGLSL